LSLKLLLKRGALLAAANWPVVAIQFAAQTTFQVLLAVPILGAAVLVAVFMDGDLASLLQGGMREIFATITDALVAEPFALIAFIAAFAIALIGGSILMFLVKGGTVEVILAANQQVGEIERRPLTLSSLVEGAAFSIPRFMRGSGRLFMPYLRLGLALMLAYGLTGAAYMAFSVYGYRAAGDGALFIGWTLVWAIATIALFLWITAINLVYLLLQIAVATGQPRVGDASLAVARFVRADFRELSGIFLIVFGVLVTAWLVSALAWSGVGLIAFVPLVGLAVFPLQIVALLVRGLVFEYIGLAAMGAYVTLYQRYQSAQAAGSSERTSPLQGDPRLHPAH
jgi:hypothetical protein